MKVMYFALIFLALISLVSNSVAEDNINQIIKAVKSKDYSSLEKLITDSTDINAAGDFGETPFIAAMMSEDYEMMDFLLSKGADVNIGYQGQTPLALSVRVSIDVLKYLLEHGAEVDGRIDNGVTALIQAVMLRKPDEVKLLLEAGAKVNINSSSGEPLLFYAFKFPPPSVKIIHYLIDHGADINSKDKWGTPAIVRAARCGKVAPVKLLLDFGADINATDKDYGRTALFWAAGFGFKEIVVELLKRGADVNIMDKHKITPLQTAISNKRTEIVELLKAAGAQ